MSHFIYIIECTNGAYYIGYTVDMERRYQEHLKGSPKCKYTRSFPPKNLAACWEIFSDRSSVLKIECGLKKLKRKDKVELVNNPGALMLILGRVKLKEVDLTKIECNRFHLKSVTPTD